MASEEDKAVAKLHLESLRLQSEQKRDNEALNATMQLLKTMCDQSLALGKERQALFLNEMLAAVNRETKVYTKRLQAVAILMGRDLSE